MRSERKCYSFMCPEYPKCIHSAGSCCAVDWGGSDDDRRTAMIMPDECFDHGDMRLFEARPERFSPGKS